MEGRTQVLNLRLRWVLLLSIFLRWQQEISFVRAGDPRWENTESARLVFVSNCREDSVKPCGTVEAELKFPKELGTVLTVGTLTQRFEHLLSVGPNVTNKPKPKGVAVTTWPVPPSLFNPTRWLSLRRLLKLPSPFPATQTLDTLRGKTLLVHPLVHTLDDYVTHSQIAVDTSFLNLLPKTGYPPIPTLWMFPSSFTPTTPAHSTSEGGESLKTARDADASSSVPSLTVLTLLGTSPFVTLQSILTSYASQLKVTTQQLPNNPQGPGEGEGEIRIHTPTADKLARLFPSLMYFPLKFLNLENPAAFQIDIVQLHAFPTSLSSYLCTSVEKHLFTEAGLIDLEIAASRQFLVQDGEVFQPLQAAFAARRPWDTNEEQDPTVVLLQWWISEDGKEIWTESPLSWSFPDVDNSTVQEMADMEEAFSMADVVAKHSGAQFNSLQSFFMRPINVEAFRTWNPRAFVASPADAVVQNIITVKPKPDGYIRDAVVPQVKSTTFDLMRFLFGGSAGNNAGIKLNSTDNRLILSIHYLSPQDYHRFHSPADWTISESIYLPGCTPSVNRATLSSRDGVLHHYERTNLIGHWDPLARGEKLFFSVALVAARFVGGLSLFWEEQPLKPRGPKCPCSKADVYGSESKAHDLPVCMGQELGSFRLGSTVVLAYEAPMDFDPTLLGECARASVLQPAVVSRSGLRRPLLPRCAAFATNYESPLHYLDAIKENLQFGEQLRHNFLLPPKWRKAGRARAEKIRAIERGLIGRFALSKYLFLFGEQILGPKAHLLLAQPFTLSQAGGEDKLGRFLPKCYRDSNSINVELTGRLSTVSLILPVNGNEKLLFKHPFYGCVGDAALGKVSRGIDAIWRLHGSHLQVELTLTVGTVIGSEPRKISVAENKLVMEADCNKNWLNHAPGTTVTACMLQSMKREVDSNPKLTSLKNRDLWQAYKGVQSVS
ncbi:YALI0D21604p, related [Neospora caninum Liverpool]|uniref:YALI0D21604p, related n=1 Tax=Neospora caninum (strain Liverpool) TaxID=572307 RepID=F0VJG4_NEOCL|nr:YALI0D21604p, related [Neospora caninum Liverpool]CBZ53875.1 YALI0D21604p, related [Neospora caninum Liverpool]|eukprot:XP_003883907.1 YALI0D21604p, related [Neospora caninum Liverpool]